MTEKCFVDTNIFVYARDRSDSIKQKRAQDLIVSLWQNSAMVISTQVITEFCAALAKKFIVDPLLVQQEAQRLLAFNPIPVDKVVLQQGLLVRQNYQLSWWDSWIVGAAVISQCAILYSEDFADSVSYYGVTVRNPFVAHD